MLPLITTVSLSASLETSPTHIDFGRVRPQVQLEREVTLTNTGNQPVDILEITGDCGCTGGRGVGKPGGLPDKTHLTPGDSTVLKISFNTSNYQGALHRLLLIHSSTGGDRAVSLRMIVSAFDHWEVNPFPVVLNPGPGARESTGRFSLVPAEAGRHRVTAVASAAAWLQAELEENHREDRQAITLRTLPGAPVGEQRVQLSVQTDDPREPLLVVPVIVTLPSLARLIPNPVVLPSVPVGRMSSASFQVRDWPGDTPPLIEVEGAKVTSLGWRDGAPAFLVEMEAATPGVLTRKIRCYAGTALLLEAPLLLRASAVGADASRPVGPPPRR